jgi:hypothetical protein
MATIPESPIQTVLDHLIEFARLDADWDSYGAEPVSSHAIGLASRLLLDIDRQALDLVGNYPQPFAAPLSDGGVQIEWKNKHTKIGVQIAPDGALGYLLVEGDKPNRSSKEEHDVAWSDIEKLILHVLTNG